MQFTQLEFIIVVSVVVLAVNALRSHFAKKSIIFLASLYFYSYIDFRFLFLLLLATFLTYVAGRIIHGSKLLKVRQFVLVLTILINLLILFVFKYFEFFIEQIAGIFSPVGAATGIVNLFMPVGVSFYTFRFVSYLVDIYRKKMPPASLYDFVFYGTFFSIIISGPIARAELFIPQLQRIETSKKKLYSGYRLFVIGLFLKVYVADNIAYFVNYYFENFEVFNTGTAWLAVVSYSIQIYCDFAGYSSMAIGTALMLGLTIEENFNFPYLARNVIGFWGRWHITLSTWIKDYLYIPLGGNRKGTARQYLNLFIVMTLCGLWHGAAWTFVFWGMFHGVLLIINHSWRETKCRNRLLALPRCYALGSWFMTFFSVTIGWVIFRSSDMVQATTIISKLFSFNGAGIAWHQPFVIFILLATISFHVLVHLKFEFVSLPINNIITPTVLFCCLWLVIVFYPSTFQPFVYAQF